MENGCSCRGAVRTLLRGAGFLLMLAKGEGGHSPDSAGLEGEPQDRRQVEMREEGDRSKESLKLGTSSPSFSMSLNPVWGRNLVYGPDWPGDLHTVLLLQPCKQHRQDVLTGKTWHGQASYYFPPGPRPGQLLWPSGISVAGGHLETLCRAGFHPLGFYVTLPSIPYPVLASHCQPQVPCICGDSGPQNRVSVKSRGMDM